jgi:dihydroflavonol-4-reductase
VAEAQTVLVTGASGFIAKHIVRELLATGRRVRGTVREPGRAEEVRSAVRPHLADPACADSLLDFAIADLGRDEGWAAAAEGADAIIHTASPFPLSFRGDPEELIRPAVDGTLRALRAAHGAGIRRAVLTSSTASVMYRKPLPAGRPLDERDWSDLGADWITPYARSKTMAEKAAWEFVAKAAPDLKLTTILPGLVLGPPLDARHGSSLALVGRMLSGRDPMVPAFDLPVVDVRDVARMHVQALDLPATEGRRFLCVESSRWMGEMAAELKAAFPGRRVATTPAPGFLVRLLGLFDPAARSVVPVLGERHQFSNAAARETFGIAFTPFREALRAAGQAVEAARAARQR